MKRFVLITVAAMAVVLLATINVRLNLQEKNDKLSSLTLSQLDVMATAEQGNPICHVSRTCAKTVHTNGEWVEKDYGTIECWSYTAGETCSTSGNSVTCGGTTHSCE
jgi:hypothetical protein